MAPRRLPATATGRFPAMEERSASWAATTSRRREQARHSLRQGLLRAERLSGQALRWAADRTTLFLNGPGKEGRTSLSSWSRGHGANYDPLELSAIAADGTVLARGTVEGRQKVFLSLPTLRRTRYR